MKRNWPFYIITASIFITIVGVTLLSDGMFFDGVYYANFSKVMAEDFQGFWVLRDCSECKNLYGHPPLAIFLESVWFKILGNSIYVERVYSLSTYIISAFLIHYIFKKLNPTKAHYSFIPILFWIITPLVTWGAANNMLENTLTIFVLIPVLLLISSIHSFNILRLIFAGFFVFLAFLTKGFIGTFPLVFLGLYWLFFRNISFKEMMFKTAIVIISFLIPFVFIFLFSESGALYLNNYFSLQVLNSIQNETTVSSRFFIIWRLLNELLPSLILILLIFIFNRKHIIKTNSKWAYFFLVFGLFGVFPIMISLKQSSFYIISALPFFSISFSMFLLSHFKMNFEQLIKIKWIKKISIVCLFISLSVMFSQIGKIGRDKEIIEDIYAVLNYTEEKTISIPHKLYWHWALKAYFLRCGGVELSSEHDMLNDFFLIEKGENDELLNSYTLIDELPLSKFNLFKRN